MSDIGASVYSEAKSEYTKQLTHYILTPFHRFFMDSFTKATEEEPNGRKVLSHFQDILSQIPEWNIDKVERETTKIITETHCDYLEELVTAVFIAHTKILTAIRLNNKNKKVQITVPKLNHFIHRALTESGRLLWSSIFLFQNDLSSIEKQKNHRQIEGLIKDGIQHAISGLLPIKSILKDNIPNGDDLDDEEEEEVEAKEDIKAKEEVEAEAEAEAEVVPEIKPEIKEEVVAEVKEEVVAEVKPEIKEEVKEEVKEELKEEVKEEVKPEIKLEAKEIPIAKKVEVIKEETVYQSPSTIIIDASPQVKFADMIHTHEPAGEMGYENSPIHDDGDDNIKILDDESGEISDFEDLDAAPFEDMGLGDFETL
jgi:hypothetical protein